MVRFSAMATWMPHVLPRCWGGFMLVYAPPLFGQVKSSQVVPASVAFFPAALALAKARSPITIRASEKWTAAL